MVLSHQGFLKFCFLTVELHDVMCLQTAWRHHSYFDRTIRHELLVGARPLLLPVPVPREGTPPFMKNGVFWDVTSYGSCKNRRFRVTYRLLHQVDKNL
jgi:hypothetical protein